MTETNQMKVARCPHCQQYFRTTTSAVCPHCQRPVDLAATWTADITEVLPHITQMYACNFCGGSICVTWHVNDPAFGKIAQCDNCHELQIARPNMLHLAWVNEDHD